MNVRLTWVQPEDLIGHELRQAAEDGRNAAAVEARWLAAGGAPAPVSTGASATPAPPHLRGLAERLLDELAALPSPLAPAEPTLLAQIKRACPHWPGSSPAGRSTSYGGQSEDTGQPPRSPGPDPGSASAGPSTRTGPPGPQGHTHPPGPTRRTRRSGRTAEAEETPAFRAGPALPPAPALPCSSTPSGTVSAPGLAERLHASWLGRAAGCLLGKPVEKLPLPAIRALARATGNWPLNDWFTARGVPPALAAAHPWNRRSAATSLAENIDGMPEDDDLNYPLLNLLLLQRYGPGFGTDDVARLWLDELPAGRTFTAERIAYRNLLSGLEPPLTATRRNPFREWIGARIRADVHGWTHPGDPAAAAEQAYRDAALTHTANGVYGAMFTAAVIATASSGTADVHESLAAGLTVVPPDSRLARAVRFGIATARAHADFDAVADRLHAAYRAYHWVHAVPNTALLSAALTHADGDFTHSICRAVSGGWDTDSNGATAGSVAGLLAGHPEAMPERWTSPLKNRLTTSVHTFDGIGFDTLAALTLQEALRS
ncbi:ADP-ribosylglycohydrolase family protein [Streptomyces sp. SP18CS02]|uniref:ADP-ribosylglycohydrolase family protein n=1 Tax=Streptomyces sp. SP18CS02 TaxID=3002531 RepID=UPI002E787D6A|nr:ADP-ribosylglycohydrolase family protein [Streptomyces sp. SP18CS02]MEE1755013.1 ADP-ribosylglycohydrolase family protein [Streptomyces sp. SP18CS02]